jgi:hypothetical protein
VALVWCGLPAKTAAAPAETKRPASVPAEDAQAETPDPWAPFHLLKGRWQGSIEGILGQGTGKSSCEFSLAYGGDSLHNPYERPCLSKKSWTYLRTVDTIAASPDKTSIEPRSREALQSLGALWAAK